MKKKNEKKKRSRQFEIATRRILDTIAVSQSPKSRLFKHGWFKSKKLHKFLSRVVPSRKEELNNECDESESDVNFDPILCCFVVDSYWKQT